MSGGDRLQLAGVGTAIITPFTADGSAVDFDALTKLVESQLEDGIKFLVPCGTTGECPTLSKDEQIAVISRVVEIVNGRIPVVAGTGSNSTAKTVEMTLAAKKAGADAALVVCPYYNKPSQAGLYNHFATVAKEAGLPIVLYNIPGRTGINMQPETVARLYNDFKEVCAIKEATGSLDQSTRIGELCPIPILSGDDALTLPLMSVGAVGVVSVISNIKPVAICSIVDAFAKGDVKTATANHIKYNKLMRTMFIESNPAPVKRAAKELGICESAVRAPLAAMEASNEEKLLDVLRSYA